MKTQHNVSFPNWFPAAGLGIAGFAGIIGLVSGSCGGYQWSQPRPAPDGGWGGQTDDGTLWRMPARLPDYQEKKMTWQGVMTTTVMMMMMKMAELISVGGRGWMAAPYLWSKDHCIESVAMVNEQPRIIFELPIEMDPNGDNTPSGDGQLGRNTGISPTAHCHWWC